jgi:mono/diheme cytochrome c family protein
VFTAMLAAAVACGISFSVAAQQTKSPWDRIYSSAQAKRGQKLYFENCGLCHGGSLLGTPAGPALAGPAFTYKWNNRSLGELFDYMQLVMPVFNPGGLTRQQNADILAFMLDVNKFPSGTAELPHDSQVVHQYRFLAAKGDPGAAVPAASTDAVNEDPNKGGRFYTREQAARGKLLFGKYCATCHPAPQGAKETPSSTASMMSTAFGGRIALEQKVIGMQKDTYPSVFYFFDKLASMPPWDTTTVSPQMKADITAYVLQANSFPSGSEELRPDVTAMKSMILNEPGFKSVFNGKNLDGIKFVLGINCFPAPDGCVDRIPGR